MYVLDNICSIIYLCNNDIRIIFLENVYGVKYYCFFYNFCFLYLILFDSNKYVIKVKFILCNIRMWGVFIVI